jgi:restriction endonuclease S subunit
MNSKYKLTDTGKTPEDWKTSKISDNCEIITGGTPNTKINEYLSSGG